ncbi:MAG: DUF1593 domain-containing protein [candidate division KSB1 bacterium]|nr:DUF1593 domain-containing protein [candidate division KSB1 bacterium]
MLRRLFIFCLVGLAAAIAKERVIILTDIANEPDDKMSMVRLMLYANEFELEGLIATTSCWLRTDPKPSEILDVVNAYALVRENLLLHASGYPTAEYLKSLIKKGNSGYGMADVGDGKSSEGSRHIISVVDRNDPRPVWICIWGGANTLAQALWDVQRSRSAEETERFISKIRVYELAGQDDAGAWMTQTFPYLYFIRSVVQWQGISYRVDSNAWPESRGGDESVFSPEWVDENIQHHHGPLGALYPDAAYLHEGDTPTFLYLLPTGLSDPYQPSWGGWGGRFTAEPQINPRSKNPSGDDEAKYEDFWMFHEASDSWKWKNIAYHNVYCAVFRWRVDFQNDFAARMDWCVKPFDQANHNPIVVLDGDSTKNVLIRRVKPGERILLDASRTYDPDGDSLQFHWWIYPEPGTYPTKIYPGRADGPILDFFVPADAAGKTIHWVLTVQDAGDPPLYTYRRVVLQVEPYQEPVDLTPPKITNAPNGPFVDYRLQVPILLTSDERAFLRFDYADKSFREMAFEFSEGQGGIRHRAWIPAEQGLNVTIYVRAKDLAGNETPNSLLISFFVDTLEQPITWKDLRYPNTWPKGPAPIGSGFEEIHTPVADVRTFYVRSTLRIEKVREIKQMKMRFRFKDGLVIYLNGHELRRLNMPDGAVDYHTEAVRPNNVGSTVTRYLYDQDLALLKEGDNQIAVEVHKAAGDQGPCWFDAEFALDGKIVHPFGGEWYYYDQGQEPAALTLRDLLADVSQAAVPDVPEIAPNYPNPFNGSTVIRFTLPTASHVTISIYDILGRKVYLAADAVFPAGSHQVVWDGTDQNGASAAGGVYLYRVQTRYGSETGKMMLIR